MNFHGRSGLCLKNVFSADPQILQRKTKRPFFSRNINLNTVKPGNFMCGNKHKFPILNRGNFTNEKPPVPDEIPVNNFFVFAIKMKLAPRAGKNLPDMFLFPHIGAVSVQNMTIIIGNGRHIQSRFLAPFNLQRRYRHF